MAKSRRNSYSNRRQTSDSSLIQSAGSMYRATLPYQADPVGSFLESFNETFDKIQVKKDADYAKVELEMSEHLEEFGELKEFANGLSSEKKAQITPWLRARRDELYDAKKRLHEAKPKERDSIRAEIDDIMSTVENSAKTNSDMITYFNSVAGAKLGNGNGMISPEKSKNTLQNMLGQDSTFNSKDGTWEYEKGMYQIAEEERVAIMENFSQGLKFGQDNAAAYPTEEERKNWRTSDQGVLQKASFKNLLNENAVVSMLFDKHGFNDGGYFNATLFALKQLKNPNKEDSLKLKEYDDNLSKLRMGRGTEEYNQAIEYFREELATKMMDQFNLSVQRGFNSVTSNDEEEEFDYEVQTGIDSLDEKNYFTENIESPFTKKDENGRVVLKTTSELFDPKDEFTINEIEQEIRKYDGLDEKDDISIIQYSRQVGGIATNPEYPDAIEVITTINTMVEDPNDEKKNIMIPKRSSRKYSSLSKFIESMNEKKLIYKRNIASAQVRSNPTK
jgi:hypothetical protein